MVYDNESDRRIDLFESDDEEEVAEDEDEDEDEDEEFEYIPASDDDSESDIDDPLPQQKGRAATQHPGKKMLANYSKELSDVYDFSIHESSKEEGESETPLCIDADGKPGKFSFFCNR